jgi:mRNA interferase YafQ
MPEIKFSRRFLASLRVLDRAGLVSAEDFQHFLYLLTKTDELPPEYGEHPLTDNWEGYRDAHLAGDVVVIFKRRPKEVRLERIGTHAQLFSSRKIQAKGGKKPSDKNFEEAVDEAFDAAARRFKRWWMGRGRP